jgi:hypothetical protein
VGTKRQKRVKRAKSCRLSTGIALILLCSKVWLTQQQMADLFLTTRNNVTLHIGNIFKEGELVETSVRKDSLLTASDGKKI